MKIEAINTGFVSNKSIRKSSYKPAFGRNWQEHASWGANYIKETGTTNFKLFSFPDAKAVFVEVASKISAGMDNIKERIVQVLGTAGTAFTIKEVFSKDDKSSVYPMKNMGTEFMKQTE